MECGTGAQRRLTYRANHLADEQLAGNPAGSAPLAISATFAVEVVNSDVFMTVTVAVDGGASRCRLAAYGEKGKLLARAEVDGHASLSNGVDSAWRNIRQGLSALAVKQNLPLSWQPDQLAMGLAGSLQEQRRRALLDQIPRAIHTLLVTDGYAQLMGASGGSPGICLAVGTGSVLHWQDRSGLQGMAGGWGFPVGDEGSGAWLGKRLVQTYVWHLDGKTQDAAIMTAVEQRIGSSISEVQGWSTQSQSSVFAQLAPLVFEYASRGDALANDLLDEAVRHCLNLIALAPQELPVYVVGGVGEQLRPRLLDALATRLSRAEGDALHGLWRIAQQANVS